jgi:cell division protein FtsW (lipid II flippase)
MQIYFFIPNYVYFFILIIFVSIIFHLKSSLDKNYLMSHILYMIFNFLLSCVLFFTATREVIN